MADSDPVLHIKPFKGRAFAADMSDSVPVKPFTNQGQAMMFSSNGTRPNKVTKPKVLAESPQIGTIEEAPSPEGEGCLSVDWHAMIASSTKIIVQKALKFL
eukprot:GABU01009125.1.p2 GENE.GABU01009125.1~~GABU01009125.1.p2  ORF type:complete len:101 (-),score=5.12 GABU01009125.1:239-541(-)